MFLSVRSYNFRNLVNERLSTEAKNIYLIGENGQGKSNFLELIYLLCFGGSFRTRQDELLITQGKEDMMVEGAFLDRNSQQNTISCKLEKERKEIRQNGKIVADRKDLIENIPCIVFKHEDIYFVNGSPERRRLFFNQVMGIYDIPFLEKLREYSKILRMRNAVLKEKKLDFLPVLDRQLAASGLELVERRKVVTEEFSPLFSQVFKEVSGSDMTIKLRYQPSWGEAESLEAVTALLTVKQKRDLETGMTNWGPHRDRFCFYMSNKDFSKIASTGQSRL
ncbi:MAG: DNA replication/repair protein RecF, partial [Spirochaetia bacterium]|nr:DNA replication/repair protein RecF [Spirochaetia bacterium]